jgi:hypothetical protein
MSFAIHPSHPNVRINPIQETESDTLVSLTSTSNDDNSKHNSAVSRTRQNLVGLTSSRLSMHDTGEIGDYH